MEQTLTVNRVDLTDGGEVKSKKIKVQVQKAPELKKKP